MRVICQNAYKFSELNDNTKERARDWYRGINTDIAWSEENKDSLEAFVKLFPITVKDWSYGGRGEGVYFVIDDENVEGLRGLRLHRWIMNNVHPKIYKGKYYSMNGTYTDGKYSYKSRHSQCQLESSCPLTGYCVDDDLLDPIHKFLKQPTSDTTLKDLLEDCFSSWIKACNDDIEYQNSDEVIDQTLEDCYEFSEEGKRI